MIFVGYRPKLFRSIAHGLLHKNFYNRARPGRGKEFSLLCVMIESVQNPEVKRVVKLRRARIRRNEGLFIVEGHREIGVAMSADAVLREVFFCRQLFRDQKQEDLLAELWKQGVTLIEMAQGPFEKISMRDHPDGLLALVPTWETSLESLALADNALVLVIAGIEKPGNLGAVLRSAEAFGVNALLCVDPQLDLFNPNVVRASQGLLFRVPTALCEQRAALDFLHRCNLRTFASSAHCEKPIWEADFRGSAAIVLGNEAHGLDPFWLENADEKLTIPMQGKANSLNLSVAAGCLLAEAQRQRL